MTIKTSNNVANSVDLESLAETHPDECSSCNFLNREFERQIQTVDEFLKAFAGREVWLNLCVRWNIERETVASQKLASAKARNQAAFGNTAARHQS